MGVGRSKAQTAVELLLLLSISLVALAIIYNLYFGQVEANAFAQERTVTQNTLQRMVNAANTLQFSSSGAKMRVLVELPEYAQLSDSNITGNTLIVKLSDGSQVFATADVNFSGVWKKQGSKYVTGKYYATFVFDGTRVNIYYDDYDLSSESIYVSAKQGTSTEKSFSVRNNSAQQATFWLESSFSHSPFASVTLGSGDDYFVLASGETRIIDLTLTLSASAYGNYSGQITVIGQINDGTSDTNITRAVSVSIESFLEVQELMVYPKTTTFSSFPGVSKVKDFSVCNASSSSATLSWSRNSTADANMISWFDFPFVDEDDQEINYLPAYSCKEFSINFAVPSDAISKTYDSNITITYLDGNIFVAYIYATIFDWENIFYNTQLEFDGNLGVSSTFVSSSLSGKVYPNGELDWNAFARNDSNESLVNGELASDNNIAGLFTSNLIGLWHLNSDYLDSSGNNNSLSPGNFDNDENSFCLWDTNCYSLDGSNDYIYTSNLTSLLSDESVTLSVWFYPRAAGVIVSEIGQASINSGWHDSQIEILSTGEVKVRVWSLTAVSLGFVNWNSWNHAVLRYSKSGLRLDGFLNGTSSLGYVAGDRSAPSESGYLQYYALGAIDSTHLGSGAYFNGKVEEFSIWNRALTNGEVNLLYATQKGNWMDRNLLLYYKFNSFNGTKIYDSAGGNAGTLTGGATVTSGLWDNNALYCDGSNDYVYSTYHSDFETQANREFTYEAWVQSSDYTTKGVIMAKRHNCNNDAHFNIYTLNNRAYLSFYSDLDTAARSIYSNVVLVNGKPYHIVWTRKWGEASTKLYINGVSQTVNNDGATRGTTYTGWTIPIFIGAQNTGTTCGGAPENYFKGIIDEVKIYNRILSADEVLADYNSALNAMYVSVPVQLTNETPAFLSAKINSDINYNFGSEISSADTQFFDQNLLGLFHFNDDLVDSSGHSKDSTANSSSFASGLWGTNTVSFDGTNDYVDLPALGGSANAISFWVKPSTAIDKTTSFKMLLNQTGSDVIYATLGNVTGGLANETIAVYNTSFSYVDNFVIPSDTFTNLVFNLEGGFYHIYVNGLDLTAAAAATAIGNNALSLGIRKSLMDGDFSGSIEEFAVWDRALTVAEIKDLYRKGISKMDLNVYSCNDASCSSIAGTKQFTSVANNSSLNISSLASANYVRYAVGFGKANGFSDLNYTNNYFYTVPYLTDFNLIYSG